LFEEQPDITGGSDAISKNVTCISKMKILLKNENIIPLVHAI